MSRVNKQTEEIFFTLLRAGLWEKEVGLSSFGEIDYDAVYQLSEEQSVLGIIAAGIEHIEDDKVPQDIVLQFAGQTLLLEQRNQAMNNVIGSLVKKMRSNGIYTLLVKGQGVAQCYEKPLWRSSGDVDFYMSDTDFIKAKEFFRPLVDSFDPDNDRSQHINMLYDSWVIEIHANQYCSISPRINRVIDEIHYDLFYGGNVRCTTIGGAEVFLPSPDNDVLLSFTHYLNHFYKGGLGVRQICDWCRLLWTYRNDIDIELLVRRLNKMGMITEWKAFAAFAVGYLGMPQEAMPLYSEHNCWKRKAKRICSFIIEVGNFGHNRDFNYNEAQPRLIRKSFSMWRRIGDVFCHARIFPMDTLRFFISIIVFGLKAVARGE